MCENVLHTLRGEPVSELTGISCYRGGRPSPQNLTSWGSRSWDSDPHLLELVPGPFPLCPPDTESSEEAFLSNGVVQNFLLISVPLGENIS